MKSIFQPKHSGASRVIVTEDTPALCETPVLPPATIGKSLVILGEVTGSEPIYLEGKIEGSIYLPGNRLTVGPCGQVVGDVVAREIVVRGSIEGDCHASEWMDMRSECSIRGDTTAGRISIEDGASFKGRISIEDGAPFQPRSETGRFSVRSVG